MCGITGWIDWTGDMKNQGNIIANMTEKLAARGPDASGMYIAPYVGFGHRRLSVVDPENGAQPMIIMRGDRKYVITYNGELYNTLELRRELESRGYNFRTHCDTEVLLTAYIEWGAQSVARFNGIFAFGIWDEEKEQLFMARDRIGVKPLFYAHRGSGLLFASELKALLAHPAVRPEIDEEGLSEIFMIGPARTPGHGVFRGVQELKAGHMMLYGRNGTRITQYWSLVSKPHEDDFPATVKVVRELMHDIVQRQLVSDVPVCTLLSGGLDSSILTSLASSFYKQEQKGDLHTYSVDYVENDQYFCADSFQPNADAPWVKAISTYLGTQHHEILIDNAELAANLPAAAFARDLPGMADVDASLYLFCREIKKGATVALSGECADEVFGGYPWFYRNDMVNATTFPWSMNPALRLEWLSPLVKEKVRSLDYVYERYCDALAEVPRLIGESSIDARIREIFYLSLTRWMPTLLDRKDRMSMAFGLEVRVPYCDHRLVEYVWNVPWSMKYHTGREKGLLREAMTGVLPEDALWRRKSPYPKTHHPVYAEKVRKWALSILQDPQSPLVPLIQTETIRSLALVPQGRASIPWFGQLMGTTQLFAYLIQMDSWLREYKVELV